MLGLHIRPCQLQSTSDNRSIIDPAQTGNYIGHKVKGQDNVAQGTHEDQLDDLWRIDVIHAVEYSQKLRQKMELPARIPDEQYEPARRIKTGEKCQQFKHSIDLLTWLLHSKPL